MRNSRRICEVSVSVVLVAALGLFTRPPLLAQEVYKSVDVQGHVVYSDRGISKTAPKSQVHVDEPDPAEVARLAKEQQLLDAADLERKKEQAAADHDKAVEDRNRQQKQKACDNARNNYFRLNDTNRIFKRDADGNRVYYSDTEADALREQAKRAMTAACGG
jgi:uncharacterized protein DUF4124